MLVPRILTVTLAAVAIAAFAAPVRAAEFREFDRASFDAAQAQGRSILLDVHAWWCPVCASQAGTVKATVAASKYDKLVIFRIDYDRQKPEWKSFGVQKQATLIAFKGKREIGRIAYQTDKAMIRRLLADSLGS